MLHASEKEIGYMLNLHILGIFNDKSFVSWVCLKTASESIVIQNFALSLLYGLI